jgi:hypothetical protein
VQLLKWIFTCIIGLILFISLILLAVVFAINETLLNADFIISVLAGIDVADMIGDALQKEMQGNMPDELHEIISRMDRDIPKDIQHTLEEKTKALIEKNLGSPIRAFYHYMLGKTDMFDVVIPLSTVKNEIKVIVYDYLSVFLDSQPAEYRQIIKKNVDSWWDTYASRMPSELNVSAMILDNNGVAFVEQVRTYLSYVQKVVIALIILIVVLVIITILIHRNFQASLRIPGIILLIAGFILFSINTFTGNFIIEVFFSKKIPDYLLTAISLILSEILKRMQLFSIIAICVGSVLIGVSFFIKVKEKESPSHGEL